MQHALDSDDPIEPPTLWIHESPQKRGGRPKSISPPMLSALCERLIEKPDMYRDEMAVFLYDEFDTLVTISSICRALAAAGWSKKVVRRVAQERNADLRDLYLQNFIRHLLVWRGGQQRFPSTGCLQ